MLDALEKAFELRQAGQLDASHALFKNLAEAHPDEAEIQYQCAWSLDILGREQEAVEYYEKALGLGLEGENLEGALLGLGSTYRALGEYQKSQLTFEKGLQLFPGNPVLKSFYAITLYNLKQHNTAMQHLLEILVDTSKDPGIQAYSRALRFYADNLDRVWSE